MLNNVKSLFRLPNGAVGSYSTTELRTAKSVRLPLGLGESQFQGWDQRRHSGTKHQEIHHEFGSAIIVLVFLS